MPTFLQRISASVKHFLLSLDWKTDLNNQLFLNLNKDKMYAHETYIKVTRDYHFGRFNFTLGWKNKPNKHFTKVTFTFGFVCFMSST